MPKLSPHPLIAAALLLPVYPTSAGTPAIDILTAPSASSSSLSIPEFDFLRLTATQTGGMDFENGPGDLSVTNFNLSAFPTRPISLTSSLTFIPVFSYSQTNLDFENSDFPLGDEDFNSASLQGIFIQDLVNTPWFAVGWTRAELASDFQAIGTEDFTFDAALGLGYKFNDSFTLAAGILATNFNGNIRLFPGINFAWTPSEQLSIGFYGASFLAKLDIHDNWFLSADAQPGGAIWNLNDSLGNSRSVVLRSYWASISTHHRIAGELWFSAGIGYSFGNEIEIQGNRGDGPSISSDLGGAPLAQISISLHDW